ncbi:hypothetical protein CYMTET_12786 [Cymbomonas tetramitiformis]|uniref:Mitochondrial import inner membrane translocase subunit TIM22 n=1 Tax=Cymbomonas tetramitiformis TaxID=36881 RepID=A0AAE0GKZ9_9CHLO|nr:hypothetical protein CYMTET_12786 [Cymbomonas tetramitiformis]
MPENKDDFPKVYTPVKVPGIEELQQQEFTDSCITKGVISTVAGGAMGAVMGIVFGGGGIGADAPLTAEQMNKTVMQTLKEGAKDAGKRSWSYAKTFAGFGAVYSVSECYIEKFRAKHDIYNSGYAGCFTGAALAYKSGPAAQCFGCASVAAFSMLIDKYMGH